MSLPISDMKELLQGLNPAGADRTRVQTINDVRAREAARTPTIGPAPAGRAPASRLRDNTRNPIGEAVTGTGRFDLGAPGNDTPGAMANLMLNPARQGYLARTDLGDAVSKMASGNVGGGFLSGAMGAMGIVGAAAPINPMQLPKRWAVITAGNAAGQAADPAANAARMAELEKALKAQKLKYKKSTGQYRDPATGQLLPEESFFIDGISAADAEKLGREFGQNSVLTHRGLHDLEKQVVHPAKGFRPAGKADENFTDIPGVGKVTGDIDFERAIPRANPEVESMWRGMSQDPDRFPNVDKVDEAAHARMAKIYDDLPVNDPEARAGYEALAKEIDAQYDEMIKAGYTPKFVDEDPYKGANPSAQMMADIRDNRSFRVYKTNAENPHPFLTNEQNDKFRAVHDFLAHAGGGNQFGPLGEERAYRIHAQTLSPLARRALASETRGQNSWVNFGPNRNLPPAERPYATQKAALWPEEFIGDYNTFPPEGGATARAAGAPAVPPRGGKVLDDTNFPPMSEEAVNTRAPVKYPSERADVSALEPIQENIQQNFRPAVEAGLKEPGASEWYNMGELRQKMMDLSPTGAEDFEMLMKFMGPTSINSTVPQNIKKATEMFRQWKKAQSSPRAMERFKDALREGTLELPAGYGHQYQGTVNKGILKILEDGSLDAITQPKTARYSAGLAGTQAGNSVLDMHIGRAIGVPGVDSAGKPSVGFPAAGGKVQTSPQNLHYPLIEDWMIDEAKRLGLSPLQHQSAGWIGGAGKTNVADTRHPLSITNDLIDAAAKKHKISPQKAFERFVQGKIPLGQSNVPTLLGTTGAGVGGSLGFSGEGDIDERIARAIGGGLLGGAAGVVGGKRLGEAAKLSRSGQADHELWKYIQSRPEDWELFFHRGKRKLDAPRPSGPATPSNRVPILDPEYRRPK